MALIAPFEENFGGVVERTAIAAAACSQFRSVISISKS